MKTNDEAFEHQVALAGTFHSLHQCGNFFVLPNAWDVASARLFEEVGFLSVATSSAGLAVSLGYEDGESIPLGDFLRPIRRMTKVLSIPLSVDMVAGFGRNIGEVVASTRRVIEAGAVGINIEDFDHRRNVLVEPEYQSEKIRAIRGLSEEMGIHLTINARTDAVSIGKKENLGQNLEDAEFRSVQYIEAGADCVYPMGLFDRDSISHFVKTVKYPVNLMIRKGLPEIKELKKLGVTRLSFGPSASNAAMGLLWRIGKDILERDNFEKLFDGAISYDMLDSLAKKKK